MRQVKSLKLLIMKKLNVKATSKKTNFRVFNQLSLIELATIKGGNTETPPEEEENVELHG